MRHWLPWVLLRSPLVFTSKSLAFLAVSPSKIWAFDPFLCGGYPSLMCNSGGFPWNARNPSLCGRTGKGWCLKELARPCFLQFLKDWLAKQQTAWLGMVQYLLSTKTSSMMESYTKKIQSFVDYWYLSARRQMDVQRDRSGLCTPRASPAKMAWVAGPFVWVRALRSEKTWNLGRLWFWYKLNSGWIWVIWYNMI